MDDMQPQLERRYPRHQFLTYQAVIASGRSIPDALEAVASTATEHPEWDMDEELTWTEWESLGAEPVRLGRGQEG